MELIFAQGALVRDGQWGGSQPSEGTYRNPRTRRAEVSEAIPQR
jgi:hypothetical protein